METALYQYYQRKHYHFLFWWPIVPSSKC